MVGVILLTLGLVALGSCVSKKDYLVKVEEGEKLSGQLTALRSEYNTLAEQKAALDKQVATLKEDNLKLEEILKARSDNLSKNIVDLRAHVADLKKENGLLKGENETLNQNVKSLQDQIAALEEKNVALHSEAEALERQRKAEVEEMRGTYQNLLENMKGEIAKGEITITQLRGKLKVNMLDEILFDSGKTTVKPQGIEVLERVGSILLNVKDRAISIEGHTDNVPIGAELSKRYPTNWELSAVRATTVARYLQEKIGIDPGLLSAIGYGEYQPVASNESEEGQAKNRRIEIVLVPMEIVPVSRK
jgi:chemotaxis protein MotB